MAHHTSLPGHGASGVDNLNHSTKLEDCLFRPAEPTRPKIRYSGRDYGGRLGIVSGPCRSPSVPLLRNVGRPKMLVPVGPDQTHPQVSHSVQFVGCCMISANAESWRRAIGELQCLLQHREVHRISPVRIDRTEHFPPVLPLLIVSRYGHFRRLGRCLTVHDTHR